MCIGPSCPRRREIGSVSLASSARCCAHQGLPPRLHRHRVAPAHPGFSLAVQPSRQTALDSLALLPQQPLNVQHARPTLVRVPRRVQPPNSAPPLLQRPPQQPQRCPRPHHRLPGPLAALAPPPPPPPPTPPPPP